MVRQIERGECQGADRVVARQWVEREDAVHIGAVVRLVHRHQLLAHPDGCIDRQRRGVPRSEPPGTKQGMQIHHVVGMSVRDDDSIQPVAGRRAQCVEEPRGNAMAEVDDNAESVGIEQDAAAGPARLRPRTTRPRDGLRRCHTMSLDTTAPRRLSRTTQPYRPRPKPHLSCPRARPDCHRHCAPGARRAGPHGAPAPRAALVSRLLGPRRRARRAGRITSTGRHSRVP